jgi:peptidoglycan/xylan/chitin deacetylase (PgdA/CDA1 family)
MIEFVIPLAVVLAAIGAGLVAWRLVRGPAPSLPRLALRVTALGLVTTALVLGSAWHLIKSRTFQFLGEIVTHVETPDPLVALTFDDGPTPGFTEEVLSTLRNQGVKATFFVTGRELEENPAEAQRLVAEGHELGNHSYSHARMLLRSLSFIRDEVERTDQLIRATGYQGDIHFRTPYAKRFILLPWYLSRTGRKHILWDVEPESYPDVVANADKIVDHVLEKTHPGSIILLHVMYEGRAESREALPRVIQGLHERGYHFVTVSELLAAQ